MTVTSYEKTPDATSGKIVVRDEFGPLEFVGETVADLSWTYAAAAQYGHDRWTDITLYRVLQKGSEYKYVIQVVGRSVLYHNPNGVCHAGVNLAVAMLAQNTARYEALKACDKVGCRPEDLNKLADAAIVSVEEDLYTLHRCRDALAVLDVLYNRSKREKRSGLSMKLLQTASKVDDDIATAMMRTRRL